MRATNEQITGWFNIMAKQKLFHSVQHGPFALKLLSADWLSVSTRNAKGLLEIEFYDRPKTSPDGVQTTLF